MDVWVGGDRNLEIRNTSQAGHQVHRIGIAFGVRHVGTAARHVTAKGHHVAHPGLPVGARDRVHLRAGGTNAGQVCGRGQLRLADNAGDRRVGTGLGAAARAVSDGNEARRQRFQPPDTGPELGLQRLGTRREELEGKQRGRMLRPARR